MTVRRIDTGRLQLPRRHFLLDPTAGNVPESIALLNDGAGFGHYDGEFLYVLEAVKEALARIYRTRSARVLPIPGTAADALEIVLASTCGPGDVVLVVGTGVDSRLIAGAATAAGLKVAQVGEPGGGPVPPDLVAARARAVEPRLILAVHGDVGSGARQPIAELRPLADAVGAWLAADVGTTLAGEPVLVDDWGLDAAWASTQRCLNCPPGLALLAVGERFAAAAEARSVPVLALSARLADFMRPLGDTGVVSNPVAPIGLVFCMYAALGLCLAEGLENRWRRHADASNLLMEGLTRIGFVPCHPPADRLATVVAVHPPAGIDAAGIRRGLNRRHHIDFGGADNHAGDGRWLFALMGINATRPVARHVIQAVARLLG
jgi:alanine-glyoxylate transaminase/serine-glyoxylate transaminase/serine-pyruvate transaminase